MLPLGIRVSRFSRAPEGVAVVPLGLAVWSLDLLESEFFRVPEGFAVEPVGLAVEPVG